MDKPLKLFRVCKTLKLCSTVVAAPTAKLAEQVAGKLEDYQFDAQPEFLALPIDSRTEIPTDWLDVVPNSEFSDPDEHTCDQYFAPDPQPIDPKEQHALYQMLHGSAILRPPRNLLERQLYEQSGVHETADGIYFITLRPLPAELQPLVICYAIRPAYEFPSKENA